ncbi:hypothetical protein NHX12_034462, partial [Muraenolepis orangiensis]
RGVVRRPRRPLGERGGEEPRTYQGTVLLRGCLYCVGGFDGSEFLNSMRRFDPATGLWNQAAPMHSRRCYVSAAVLDGCIFAMGGYDGHTRLNSVERYEPDNNQWSLVASMHERRSDASASTLGNMGWQDTGPSTRQVAQSTAAMSASCHQAALDVGHFILADGGYPCLQQPLPLITPYKRPIRGVAAQRFNGHHSRARSIIERAFGMMKARFRAIFLQALEVKPTFVPQGQKAMDEQQDVDGVGQAVGAERTMSARTCNIFNKLRLNGELCDLVIEAEGVAFNAHKIILCGCSPYFR